MNELLFVIIAHADNAAAMCSGTLAKFATVKKIRNNV